MVRIRVKNSTESSIIGVLDWNLPLLVVCDQLAHYYYYFIAVSVSLSIHK